MKKKALLTCQAMLPLETIAELKQLLDLRIESCALGKDQLIENLHGKDVYYIGGMESADLEVLERSGFIGDIVFIGEEPRPIIKDSAWEYINANKINVYPTGGGVEAVVQSTLDVIYNPLILQDSFTKANKWNPGLPEKQLGKKNVVILGAGKIGYRVAVQLLELGHCQSVHHAGGRGPKEELIKLGIPYIEKIRDAFRFGDIISLHYALTPETRDCIRYLELNAMKKGTIFINNARAEIVHKHSVRKYIRKRPLPRTKLVWDTTWTEGPTFEKLSPMESEIVNSGIFAYTQHSCVMRHLDLALPAYGENTLRITREKILV